MADTDWISKLPGYGAPAPAPVPNWFSAGLGTGWHQALGALGSTGQAVGTLTGWQGLSDYGKSVADNQAKLAAASGRPDLEEGGEQGPWSIPGIGYQVAKAIPSIGGMVGAGMLATAALPEAAAGGAAAAIGSAVPRILGGGAQFLPRLFGATAAGYPLMVGGNVEEAKKANGGELTPGAAAGSLALGVPEAAVGGLAPASFHGPVAGNLARRLITGGAMGAAVNAPAAAVQTALQQTMGDPNKTVTERSKEIVDSALGGALVGGAFGSTLRAFQRKSPGQILTDPKALAGASDALTGSQPPDQPQPLQLTYNPKEAAPAAEAPDVIPQPGTVAPPDNDTSVPRAGPFALTPEPELRAQAEALATKERTPPEDIQHALLQEELAKRTPPGGDADTHTLFTPDEMGARVPQQQTYEETGRAKYKVPEESQIFDGVTSDAEMLNKLRQVMPQLGAKPPAFIKEMARDLGMSDTPIDERIVTQEGKVNDLWDKAKRNPGMAKRAQAAQADLATLREQKAIHDEADSLLVSRETSQEAAPAAQPDAAATAAGTEVAPAGTAASTDVLDQPPEGLKGKALEHWQNMSNLFGLLKDTDAEGAGKALAARDAIAGSQGKRGLANARDLARTYADELSAKKEEPAPAPDAVSQPAEDAEPEHPAIEDGSKLAWNTPEVEPVVGAKPPFTPRPIPVGLAADRQADVQKGLRDEARSRLQDPDTSDAEKARITSALQKADAGSHSAITETLNALDKVRAAKQPEGPWQGTDETVVGTPNVQPKVVGVVGSLMRALGLGNIRTMILHPDDVTGAGAKALGLNGDYAAAKQSADLVQTAPAHQGHVFQFGPGNKDFAMYVKPGSDADMLTAAGHEVGHIAEKVLLNNAGKSTQDAIHKAFVKELKTAGMKGQDLARLDRSSPEYAEQFSEWFANNTERWFRNGAAGEPLVARTAVDRFFQTVANKWRDVVSAITGDPEPPNAKVAAFLDSAVNSNRAVKWTGDADNKVRFKMAPGKPESVPEMSEAASTAVRGGLQAGERVVQAAVEATQNLRPKVRSLGLFAAPGDTITKRMAQMGSAAAPKFQAATELHHAINQAAAKPLSAVADAIHALPAKEQGLLARFADFVAYGIDPRASFKDQPALHEQPNSAQLQTLTDAANKHWAWIRQNAPNARAAIEQAITANRFTGVGEALFKLNRLVELNSHGTLPEGYVTDTAERLRTSDHSLQTSHDLMMSALKDNVAALKQHINSTNDLALKMDNAGQNGDSTRRTLDPLKLGLKQAEAALTATSKPYFNLGRTGDYMVSGTLPVDEKGVVKTEHVQALQDRMAADGFGNYALMKDHTNAKVFIRVGSESQLKALSTLFQEERAKGHLDPKEDIVHGNVAKLDDLHRLTPNDVRAIYERLHTAELDIPEGADPKTVQAMNAARDQLKMEMMRSYLDSLKDNALPKFSMRETVQGFSKDFIKSMQDRFAASARGMATLATSGLKAQAMRDMRDEVQGMKRVAPGMTADPTKVTQYQDFANELFRREQQRGWDVPQSPLGFMTNMTHIVSVGASPAYVLTLASQHATLVWPELAKTHGFLGAAKGMAENTGEMLRAMRSMVDVKTGRIVWDPEKAKAAGVSQKSIDTLTRLDNAGQLTPTITANYGLGEGSHDTAFKRYANLLGYTSEVNPKVMAALTAGHLYDKRAVPGMTREEFVAHVTDESNFGYGVGNTPRLLGNKGYLGPATPLIAQFQGFHTRLMAKYYRELHDVIGGSAEERAAAGKFLAGHIAAITVLAGTMGLPAAGLFAGVFDKAANALTGRDDWDIEASYRSWLSATFGKGVGEVLAKGLPRAAGVDLSHLGEQRIVPFTELVASKRKFEDARSDYMERLGGPSLGELSEMVLGSRDILNGFYQQGLEKILPGELKNLAKAYRMTAHGYEDANGLKMPLTPNAADILMRAVGIQNARLAEYNDEKETLGDLTATRQYRQQNITKHIELGLNHQNQQEFQDAIAEARQFTTEHPGVPSPLAHVGLNVEKFSKKAAIARGFGMVLGQKPTDIGLRDKLGYGNWR